MTRNAERPARHSALCPQTQTLHPPLRYCWCMCSGCWLGMGRKRIVHRVGGDLVDDALLGRCICRNCSCPSTSIAVLGLAFATRTPR